MTATRPGDRSAPALPAADAFRSHDHQACRSTALAAVAAECRDRGLKLTPARTCVLEALLESHQALTAYELLDRLRAAVLLACAPMLSPYVPVYDLAPLVPADHDLDGARVLTSRAALDPEMWRADAPPPFRREFRPSIAWRLCLAAEGRFDHLVIESTGIAEPPDTQTFSDDVSYLAMISGPSSTIRCSIVGTATSMSARCSAISASVLHVPMTIGWLMMK